MGNWTRHDTRALIEAAGERPFMSKWAVASIRRHHHEPDLVERIARLEDFVTETERTPFVWGRSDCTLMVADWAVRNGLPDSVADLRSTYASEDEARALIADNGGLVSLFGERAEAAGAVPVREPEFGCIAVIGSPHNPDRQWSAIWQGFHWIVRWGNAERAQWVPFTAKYLAMWRV